MGRGQWDKLVKKKGMPNVFACCANCGIADVFISHPWGVSCRSALHHLLLRSSSLLIPILWCLTCVCFLFIVFFFRRCHIFSLRARFCLPFSYLEHLSLICFIKSSHLLCFLYFCFSFLFNFFFFIALRMKNWRQVDELSRGCISF